MLEKFGLAENENDQQDHESTEVVYNRKLPVEMQLRLEVKLDAYYDLEREENRCFTCTSLQQ